ncbi:gp53-like domain-containing protein [Yokenella regensburgei]|uniref:gp53-like domain-containing protein n=1 Tax=Yokenella regensburgei TaxID=158877 RepID=UPI003ED87487
MNQILFELSSLTRWSSAGALNSFDNEFATSIGGYPKGSVLLVNDSIVVSTMDGNTNDPSATSTGWKNILEYVNGAPLDSPVFTGTPKVPTATAGTINTQAASTAFVKTSIDSSISALDLGTASKKDVGTGTGQIPDMSSFSSSLAVQGYAKEPSGLIIQWLGGNTSGIPAGGSVVITFPFPFPTELLAVVPYSGAQEAGFEAVVGIKWVNRSQIILYNSSLTNPVTDYGYIAYGR